MSQKVEFFVWSQPRLSPNLWLSLGWAFWLSPSWDWAAAEIKLNLNLQAESTWFNTAETACIFIVFCIFFSFFRQPACWVLTCSGSLPHIYKLLNDYCLILLWLMKFSLSLNPVRLNLCRAENHFTFSLRPNSANITKRNEQLFNVNSCSKH